MGIFSQKPKFKVTAPTVRKVTVAVETAKPKPKPTPKPTLPLRDARSTPPTLTKGSQTSSIRSGSQARSSKTLSASPPPLSAPRARHGSKLPSPLSDRPSPAGRGDSRKRKLGNGNGNRNGTARPAFPSSDLASDGSDTEDDWEAALNEGPQKRKRREGSHHVDLDRQLVHPVLRATLPRKGGEAERGDDHPGAPDTELDIINAKDVASLALRCIPVLGAAENEVSVELQYPGSKHRERYELVWGKDKIDAVKDIKTTIQHIAQVYLTDDEAGPFLDSTTGIVRQLERASSDKVKDVRMFKAALEAFNSRLLDLHNDGTLARNLAARHDLPRDLVAFVLDQVYDRTVAPNVDLLRKYENGTDNVYGELLHPFITNILVDRLQMTSSQVFVDLGSGVGNVTLQAALEIGCESWGCEMMHNACNLAEAQNKEFTERCRLWGIAAGEVHLERGNFCTNPGIQEVLKRADVILVNNQAFTSQLNEQLVNMFLDCKRGCKIVSLKSFVHEHKSASHNINDVGSTILDAETHTYPEGFVSWTGAAGTFCISTKK